MTRSLLFFSYLFPPRGGAGVQRALKLVKYLPQHEWRPLVVTCGSMAADKDTSARDPALLADLPAETVIHPTTLDVADRRRCEKMQCKWRQRLEATDPVGWWYGPAVRSGLELFREHRPSAIFVTMSPFTSAEIGIAMKQQTGLPLVLDLRDPWALDETRIYPTRWHARQDLAAMARALGAADLVVMNTPQAESRVRGHFRLSEKTRLITITNGYDEEDFAGSSAVQPPERDVLRIVHTGMFHSELARVWDDLHARRGLMNRIKYARRPINLWTRTPRYLLEALARVTTEGTIPAGKVELVLVGDQSEGDRALIAASPVAKMVRLLGYRSHVESVGWLRSADVLFLPLHTPLDGGPALIVPGKAYEYLGSGRAILAMGPPGDMRSFVQQAKAGRAIGGEDVAAAAGALGEFYKAKVAGRPLAEPDVDVVRQWRRREVARKLADALNELVNC